jgi:hypothetical protein
MRKAFPEVHWTDGIEAPGLVPQVVAQREDPKSGDG